MSQNRTFVFIAIGALALAGAAFATLPATAEEDQALEVSVVFDSTSPRLTGTVFVTYSNGTGVAAATVALSSTHDLLPLPAAETDGFTGYNGTFDFDFGYVNTASVPGDHTLTVVVTHGDLSETITVSYQA